MPVESVYPALEQLLPLVRKPVQYIGGEVNSVVKDWDSAAVRWALMYPDAYEVGVPNQGVQILYEVLNERPDVLAVTGQVAGGVAPVGHPEPITTFIDLWLDRHPRVWAGAGQPHLVFATTFAELTAVTGGEPAEVGGE